MAKLILTAENFAFGPIGKLLYVADLLKEKGHYLIFAGFGTSLQLAKKFQFDEIYEIDTDEESSNDQLKKIIGKADLLVSSMDLPSVVVAKHLKKPVVWIDCLFWFWSSVFEPVLDVELFVREKTMNDKVNEAKFGPKIKNFYTVGPIMGKPQNLARAHQAFVSYGGGEASHWYKVGHDTNYPFFVTAILHDYVDWDKFDRVIIATGEHIVQKLKKRFKNSRFEFKCLPHKEFLNELARSEILLTTAGLVTTQSAFQCETPVLFLPSSNDAHYLLLEELRERGLAKASVELSDYLEKLNFHGKSDSENIAEVLGQLRTVERFPDIQAKIGRAINRWVQNRHDWSSSSAISGKKFIESLGSSGTETVAEKIDHMVTAFKEN